MMAHATFEFAFKQLVERTEDYKKKPGMKPLDQLAERLEAVTGKLAALHSSDWKAVLLLAKVRNLIAHAGGFQDRDFVFDELDFLGELGIRDAVGVGDPPLAAFMYEAKCVSACVDIYLRVLDALYKELEGLSSARS